MSNRPWSGQCSAFCTSMVEPESAATLPLAPLKALEGDAAPAADAPAVAATNVVTLVPIESCSSGGDWCFAGLGLHWFPSLLVLLFASQRVDGRQMGRPAGRVHAEGDADGQGHDERPTMARRD